MPRDDILSPRLVEAIINLWKLSPHSWPKVAETAEFRCLRDCVQVDYPLEFDRPVLDFALRCALVALGMPASLGCGREYLSLQPLEATFRLDTALRKSHVKRVHLCPLNGCSGDLPTLTFGSNRVARLSEEEFKGLIDADRLIRTNPLWTIEASRFAQFTWLIVEETVPAKPGAFFRTILDVRADLIGSVKPHQPRFPQVVEDALFVLLLQPWEDWRWSIWRPFWVPWVYTVEEDIFCWTAAPPSADTLAWIPRIGPDGIEDGECPAEVLLDEAAPALITKLDDDCWATLLEARNGPLFETPIAHFLVRAFLADGIDEFIAHVTTIEAALGLQLDHSQRQRPAWSNPNSQRGSGATARVAARLARLLKDPDADDGFHRLFCKRSEFIHGRRIDDVIRIETLVEARRLARRAAAALIETASNEHPPTCRETYLNGLLSS